MLTPQQQYNKIIDTLKTLNPDLTAKQIGLVTKAYDFAMAAHHGQKRLSGEDYIMHPLATALLLAQMHVDCTTVAAGLLHDVPEDTVVSLDQIKEEFGPEIAVIVEGITKLGTVKYRGIERYAENLRKMFVAMAKDIRTIVIKFCDRIHNLQTLQHQPPVKAMRTAKETLEIYAPIAHRLGMYEIKNQLEDLAFPYVYPQENAWLQSLIKDSLKNKSRVIEVAKKTLAKELEKNNIKYINISSRVKSCFSLYLKLLTHDKNIERIYDLIAMRLIVQDIRDCYATLGIIHSLWTPLKGRIKDYIAQPKPNKYQSLHTNVMTESGEIIEIQIRTQEMHDYAEYGIAAHWHYAEQKSGTVPDKDKLWINKLALWQKEIADSAQYLDDLQKVKLDFFQNRIFVFTPKGDVIDLPEEATPIDFAYHIHTVVGNQCVGARINNEQAALDTPLKSGDLVDIMTNSSRIWPNPDWIKIAKTSIARDKIRSSLRKKRKSFLNILNPFRDKE